MNNLKSTAALMASLALAAPAMAQTYPVTGARPGNEIGTGQSLPTSNNASNIGAEDTRNVIAPRLPSPEAADSDGPRAFLMAARRALASNRTGEAQEALERAESRALAGNVLASRIGEPSRQPMVQSIAAARQALASGNRAMAMQTIDQALQTN